MKQVKLFLIYLISFSLVISSYRPAWGMWQQYIPEPEQLDEAEQAGSILTPIPPILSPQMLLPPPPPPRLLELDVGRPLSIAQRLTKRKALMERQAREFERRIDPVLAAIQATLRKEKETAEKSDVYVRRLGIVQNSILAASGVLFIIAGVTLFSRCTWYAASPALASETTHWSEHSRCYGDVFGYYVAPLLGVVASSWAGMATIRHQLKKILADKRTAAQRDDLEKRLIADIRSLKGEFTKYQQQNLDFFSLVEKYETLSTFEREWAFPSGAAHLQNIYSIMHEIYAVNSSFVEAFNLLPEVRGKGQLSPYLSRHPVSGQGLILLQFTGSPGILNPRHVRKALQQVLMLEKYHGIRTHIMENINLELIEHRKSVAIGNLGKPLAERTQQIKDDICSTLFEEPDTDQKFEVRDKFFGALCRVSVRQGAKCETYREFDSISFPDELKTTEQVTDILTQLSQKLDLQNVAKLLYTELLITYPELFVDESVQ